MSMNPRHLSKARQQKRRTIDELPRRPPSPVTEPNLRDNIHPEKRPVSGLQKLPPEVRLTIWEFSDLVKKDGYIGESLNGKATTMDNFKKEVQYYRHWSCRLLCKAFSEEMLDIFYSRNGFEFFHFSVLLEFFESVGYRARQWLTKLKIHYTLAHKTKTESSSSAVNTAYKGLRYLLSCERLQHLEINARVVPLKLKTAWLEYPVLNPLSVILQSHKPLVPGLAFGPEERSGEIRKFTYDWEKSEQDCKQADATQNTLLRALGKVSLERSKPDKSKASLPNVFTGEPRAWGGKPPKDKGRDRTLPFQMHHAPLPGEDSSQYLRRIVSFDHWTLCTTLCTPHQLMHVNEWEEFLRVVLQRRNSSATDDKPQTQAEDPTACYGHPDSLLQPQYIRTLNCHIQGLHYHGNVCYHCSHYPRAAPDERKHGKRQELELSVQNRQWERGHIGIDGFRIRSNEPVEYVQHTTQYIRLESLDDNDEVFEAEQITSECRLCSNPEYSDHSAGHRPPYVAEASNHESRGCGQCQYHRTIHRAIQRRRDRSEAVYRRGRERLGYIDGRKPWELPQDEVEEYRTIMHRQHLDLREALARPDHGIHDFDNRGQIQDKLGIMDHYSYTGTQPPTWARKQEGQITTELQARLVSAAIASDVVDNTRPSFQSPGTRLSFHPAQPTPSTMMCPAGDYQLRLNTLYPSATPPSDQQHDVETNMEDSSFFYDLLDLTGCENEGGEGLSSLMHLIVSDK